MNKVESFASSVEWKAYPPVLENRTSYDTNDLDAIINAARISQVIEPSMASAAYWTLQATEWNKSRRLVKIEGDPEELVRLNANGDERRSTKKLVLIKPSELPLTELESLAALGHGDKYAPNSLIVAILIRLADLSYAAISAQQNSRSQPAKGQFWRQAAYKIDRLMESDEGKSLVLRYNRIPAEAAHSERAALLPISSRLIREARDVMTGLAELRAIEWAIEAKQKEWQAMRAKLVDRNQILTEAQAQYLKQRSRPDIVLERINMPPSFDDCP